MFPFVAKTWATAATFGTSKRLLGPIVNTLLSEEARFQQPYQMVRRKLTADGEGPGHIYRTCLAQPTDGEEHSQPQIAVFPVLSEELVAMGLRPLADRVEPSMAANMFLMHEAVLEEDAEVVANRTEAQLNLPGDRAQVISWEHEEMIVDCAPVMVT